MVSPTAARTLDGGDYEDVHFSMSSLLRMQNFPSASTYSLKSRTPLLSSSTNQITREHGGDDGPLCVLKSCKCEANEEHKESHTDEREDRVAEFRVLLIDRLVKLGTIDRPAFAGWCEAVHSNGGISFDGTLTELCSMVTYCIHNEGKHARQGRGCQQQRTASRNGKQRSHIPLGRIWKIVRTACGDPGLSLNVDGWLHELSTPTSKRTRAPSSWYYSCAYV